MELSAGWLLDEPTCIVCGGFFDRRPAHWVCLGCGVVHRMRAEVTPDDVAWVWSQVAQAALCEMMPAYALLPLLEDA